VIDVGYAGVAGASQLMDGVLPYGHMPKATSKPCHGRYFNGDPVGYIQSNGRCESPIESGDTYGPTVYVAYVPAVLAMGWSGLWDRLPAAHVAASAFDILAVAGLFVAGWRLASLRLGVALAFAWAANPFTLYSLNMNSNDALVGALVAWTLALLSFPAARGVLLAAAGLTKFAPLAIVPLFASLRNRKATILGFLAGVLVLCSMLALDADGVRLFWDRTLSYQLGRVTPMSVWTLGTYHPGWWDLRPVQHALQADAALGRFEPHRHLGGEAAQDQLRAHPDDRVVRAGHAGVGDVGRPAAQDVGVARLDVRVGAEHRRHPTVQEPPHGHLLAGRLGVEVDDHDLRLLASLAHEILGHRERAHGRIEEELAEQVDHGDRRAVGGLRHTPPLAGRRGGVVGRADDAAVHGQMLVHLPLAEGVVAERDHVDAGGVQAAGEPARDARAVGQVLAVCDHEVDLALGPQPGHLLLDDPPARCRDGIGDEEDPHRGLEEGRGRGGRPDLDVDVVAGVGGVLGHLLMEHLREVDDRAELRPCGEHGGADREVRRDVQVGQGDDVGGVRVRLDLDHASVGDAGDHVRLDADHLAVHR
jgi:Glycosyltransferase family 87